MKQITSVHNDLVHHFLSLARHKSYRQEHSQYLIHGLKLTREYLQRYPQGKSVKLVLSPERYHQSKDEMYKELKNITNKKESSEHHKQIEMIIMEKRIIDKICNGQSEGLFLQVPIPSYPTPSMNEDYNEHKSTIMSSKNILVLDGLKDPRNLGLLLRSANAFDWLDLIFIGQSVDLFNPIVISTSRNTPIYLTDVNHVDNVQTCMKVLKQKGVKNLLFATTETNWKLPQHLIHLTKEHYHEISLIDKTALVLGSESHGLQSFQSDLSLKNMDIMNMKGIHLPISNTMESLNVAVAGSLLLYLLNVYRKN